MGSVIDTLGNKTYNKTYVFIRINYKSPISFEKEIVDRMATISSKDVAREAGVSQATVSYVLNNVQGIKIKPETRQSVIAAAKRLNYHPNLIAQSMKLKKSMSIGVVSDKNVSNFMFMKVLEGIKDALLPRNYSITLCLSKSQDVDSADHIKYFKSNRIDGIIFAFATLDDEHIAYLVDNNIPFVQVHSNTRDDLIHLVKTDMSKAYREAMAHITSRGARKIAYVGLNAGNSNDRRFAGYQKTLEDLNIPLDGRLIFKMNSNEEGVEKIPEEAISGLPFKPDAVVCETARTGYQFLRYAYQNGIRIPEDIAVAAIGTSTYSVYSCPALSAIEAPLYDMGVTGAQMIFDIMKGSVSNDIVVLDWNFVQRNSC